MSTTCSSGGGFADTVIGIAVGGVLLSVLKVFFPLVWDLIKIAFAGQLGVLTLLPIIWNILMLVVKSLITTISNTFYYIPSLVKTSGFIASDEDALQQMVDYYEIHSDT